MMELLRSEKYTVYVLWQCDEEMPWERKCVNTTHAQIVQLLQLQECVY